MTDRYVIVIPHVKLRYPADDMPLGPVQPEGFVTTVSHERFHLSVSVGTPVQCRASGAVIGHIFDRQNLSQPFGLAEDGGSSICQALLKDAWGGYVTVEADTNGCVSVFRDPSGALPSYIFRHNGCTLIVSDFDALKSYGLPPLAIDWSYVLRHLGSGYLRTADTALKGLSEIPQGYCARVAPDGAVTLKELWSPWSFVGWNGQSREENAHNLRETIDGCVAGMVSGLDHIHLGLSGGLDSSILAASLHCAGARANAYTFTTDDAVGDERRYARIAAEAFEMPLAEIRYRLDAVDLTQSVASHLPRPVGLPYQQPLYAFWEAKTDRHSAAMAGNGGDEVFCLMQSATPSVDLWLSTGNIRHTLNALGDVCRLTGAPIPIAARMALKTWLTRDRPYAWRGNPRFLSADALRHSSPCQDPQLHPWLRSPYDVLPGKKAHVAHLLRVQHFVEGPRRSAGARVLYPLMAQPVVELCLQIPTWQWSSGGRSRAVARDAFAGRLPKALSSRQSKGGPEAFAAHVYLDWRERLIPFLTEGLLAINGIIDRAEVRAALMIDGPPRGFDYLRLLELADAEAWVRHMSGET